MASEALPQPPQNGAEVVENTDLTASGPRSGACPACIASGPSPPGELPHQPRTAAYGTFPASAGVRFRRPPRAPQSPWRLGTGGRGRWRPAQPNPSGRLSASNSAAMAAKSASGIRCGLLGVGGASGRDGATAIGARRPFGRWRRERAGLAAAVAATAAVIGQSPGAFSMQRTHDVRRDGVAVFVDFQEGVVRLLGVNPVPEHDHMPLSQGHHLRCFAARLSHLRVDPAAAIP
jgi:hypothetical protein